MWKSALRSLPSSRGSTVSRIPRLFYSSNLQPPPDLDQGEKQIYDKLSERFTPSHLQVQDVSGGCGTFYAITIASKAFADLPTVKQHRLVNDALKEEIKGIHGLQLKTIPETEQK